MRGVKRCAIGAALLGALGAASLARAESPVARATDALRIAAIAERSGEPAEAAAHFDRAAAIPEIAAPARLLAARAWLDAERPDAAEASIRKALTREIGAPWRADLLDALGRARDAQGDGPGARRAWQEALDAGVDPARAAELRLELAAAFEAVGELDAAARTLRSAWIEGAARATSDRAGERLAALERQSGRSFRTTADWRARAEALEAAHRVESALAAWDAVLAREPSAADRARAARGRADGLFRSRRYDDAIRAFGALGDPESRIWRARSLARANRVDEAIAAFETPHPGASPQLTAWAHFLAATLHEGRGRGDRAQALFASAARDGDAKVAADALWRLGFDALRRGDARAARRHLVALTERQADPLDRLMARYWAARALDATLPGSAEARAELAAIVREYPFSYYGVRAAEIVVTAHRSAAADANDGPITLAESDLVAAGALAGAGLDAMALRAAAALGERATTLADRVELARLHAGAGDAHRAQLVLVRNHAERLARGPGAGGDEAWRLAWPDAFARERRATAPAGASLPAFLVPALMREESGYRPDARSPVGALGLMQLMPDTARRLAASAGVRDFDPRRLVEPALNVRLGTLFLDQLAKRYAGRTEPIAAAYNAGPGAVDGWRRAPVRDEVEWVEAIPYDETRGYVKRIVRSMHVYRTLYR